MLLLLSGFCFLWLSLASSAERKTFSLPPKFLAELETKVWKNIGEELGARFDTIRPRYDRELRLCETRVNNTVDDCNRCITANQPGKARPKVPALQALLSKVHPLAGGVAGLVLKRGPLNLPVGKLFTKNLAIGGAKIATFGKNIGRGIGRGAKKGLDAIKNFGEKAGKGIKTGAETVGKGVLRGLNEVGKFGEKAGKKIAKGFKDAGRAIADLFTGKRRKRQASQCPACDKVDANLKARKIKQRVCGNEFVALQDKIYKFVAIEEWLSSTEDPIIIEVTYANDAVAFTVGDQGPEVVANPVKVTFTLGSSQKEIQLDINMPISRPELIANEVVTEILKIALN